MDVGRFGYTVASLFHIGKGNSSPECEEKIFHQAKWKVTRRPHPAGFPDTAPQRDLQIASMIALDRRKRQPNGFAPAQAA